MYVWDSLLPDAVYIALRVLFVLLSTLLLSCGNFCLDAVYMRYQLELLLQYSLECIVHMKDFVGPRGERTDVGRGERTDIVVIAEICLP